MDWLPVRYAYARLDVGYVYTQLNSTPGMYLARLAGAGPGIAWPGSPARGVFEPEQFGLSAQLGPTCKFIYLFIQLFIYLF